MSPRDLRAYLFDIAEACQRIEDFTGGASFADYQRTVLLRSAVEVNLPAVHERVNTLLLGLDGRRPNRCGWTIRFGGT